MTEQQPKPPTQSYQPLQPAQPAQPPPPYPPPQLGMQPVPQYPQPPVNYNMSQPQGNFEVAYSMSAPLVMPDREHKSLHRWQVSALVCSITSLLMTCCCWFSIPAIVLGAKEPRQGAKYGYKVSIILSSIAFVLTVGWVIFVIVWFYVLVSDGEQVVNGALENANFQSFDQY